MKFLFLIGVFVLASETKARGNSVNTTDGGVANTTDDGVANITDDGVAPTAAASLHSIFAKLAKEFDAKDEALAAKVRAQNSKFTSLTSKDTQLTSKDASLSSRIGKLEYAKNYVVINQGNGDGNVRIRASGLLEVYHNGEWGTVCDDNWGYNDAQVVCKQIGKSGGYPFGNTWGSNSDSSLPTLLDDVSCSGHESKITYCSHVDKDKENCSHNEDVHIRCNP